MDLIDDTAEKKQKEHIMINNDMKTTLLVNDIILKDVKNICTVIDGKSSNLRSLYKTLLQEFNSPQEAENTLLILNNYRYFTFNFSTKYTNEEAAGFCIYIIIDILLRQQHMEKSGFSFDYVTQNIKHILCLAGLNAFLSSRVMLRITQSMALYKNTTIHKILNRMEKNMEKIDYDNNFVFEEYINDDYYNAIMFAFMDVLFADFLEISPSCILYSKNYKHLYMSADKFRLNENYGLNSLNADMDQLIKDGCIEANVFSGKVNIDHKNFGYAGQSYFFLKYAAEMGNIYAQNIIKNILEQRPAHINGRFADCHFEIMH